MISGEIEVSIDLFTLTKEMLYRKLHFFEVLQNFFFLHPGKVQNCFQIFFKIGALKIPKVSQEDRVSSQIPTQMISCEIIIVKFAKFSRTPFLQNSSGGCILAKMWEKFLDPAYFHRANILLGSVNEFLNVYIQHGGM